MPTKKKPTRRPQNTLSVRELAQRHAAKALQKLVALVDSKNERVALSVAQTVPGRAHGKAGQAVDLKALAGRKQP